MGVLTCDIGRERLLLALSSAAEIGALNGIEEALVETYSTAGNVSYHLAVTVIGANLKTLAKWTFKVVATGFTPGSWKVKPSLAALLVDSVPSSEITVRFYVGTGASIGIEDAVIYAGYTDDFAVLLDSTTKEN